MGEGVSRRGGRGGGKRGGGRRGGRGRRVGGGGLRCLGWRGADGPGGVGRRGQY